MCASAVYIYITYIYTKEREERSRRKARESSQIKEWSKRKRKTKQNKAQIPLRTDSFLFHPPATSYPPSSDPLSSSLLFLFGVALVFSSLSLLSRALSKKICPITPQENSDTTSSSSWPARLPLRLTWDFHTKAASRVQEEGEPASAGKQEQQQAFIRCG